MAEDPIIISHESTTEWKDSKSTVKAAQRKGKAEKAALKATEKAKHKAAETVMAEEAEKALKDLKGRKAAAAAFTEK